MCQQHLQRDDVTRSRSGLSRCCGDVASKALTMAISFEACLVAFIFAGNVKGAPLLAGLPVDLTLILFGLSLVVGLLVAIRQAGIAREAVVLSALGLLFCAFALLSLTWGPGGEYGQQKAIFILTLNLWSLVGAAAIKGSGQSHIQRITAAVATLALVVAIGAFVTHAVRGFDGPWQYTVFGANYLVTGRLVGFGTLIMSAVFWCWDLSRSSRVAAGFALALLWFILLDVGSRAPIIGSAVGFLLPLLLRFNSATVKRMLSRRGVTLWLLGLAAIAAGAALYSVVFGTLPRGINRLQKLPAIILGGYNSDSRFLYMRDAVTLWLTRPILGHGCGSFPLLVGFRDARLHPHNIVLEIAAEMGLVGLGLFTALNVYALKLLGTLQRVRSDPWRMLVLMLYAGALVNAMVSGDLHDNRSLFLVIGLSCCLPVHTPRNGESVS